MEPTWGPPGSCRPKMGPNIHEPCYQGVHLTQMCVAKAWCVNFTGVVVGVVVGGGGWGWWWVVVVVGWGVTVLAVHYADTDTHHIDGLEQDCSNSNANALELLQSCTKPSTYGFQYAGYHGMICISFASYVIKVAADILLQQSCCGCEQRHRG